MSKIYPLLLILLCVISGYTLANNMGKADREYDEYMQKAQAAIEKEYYSEAIEYMMQARKIAPNYELFTRIADLYEKLGDKNNYCNVYKTAIKEFPDEADARKRLLTEYEEAKDYRNLYAVLSQALRDFPEDDEFKEYFNRFSKIYTESGNEYEQIYKFKNGYYLVKNFSAVEGEAYYTLLNEDCRYEMQNLSNIMIPSDDFTLFYKQDENGEWITVNNLGYLIAKNTNKKIEKIGVMTDCGYAAAVVDKKFHLVNQKMQISDAEWDYISTFEAGIGAARNENEWAIVAADRFADAEFIYDEIAINCYDRCCANGIVAVKEGNQWKLVNTDGSDISDNRFDYLYAFTSSQPTVGIKDNKVVFVKENAEIYLTTDYDDAKPFNNGYAAVKSNGKWGFINQNGVPVTEFIYDDVTDVSKNGTAFVKLSSYYSKLLDETIDRPYWHSIRFSYPYTKNKHQ